jgi:hypothetical protein
MCYLTWFVWMKYSSVAIFDPALQPNPFGYAFNYPAGGAASRNVEAAAAALNVGTTAAAAAARRGQRGEGGGGGKGGVTAEGGARLPRLLGERSGSSGAQRRGGSSGSSSELGAAGALGERRHRSAALEVAAAEALEVAAATATEPSVETMVVCHRRPRCSSSRRIGEARGRYGTPKRASARVPAALAGGDGTAATPTTNATSSRRASARVPAALAGGDDTAAIATTTATSSR